MSCRFTVVLPRMTEYPRRQGSRAEELSDSPALEAKRAHRPIPRGLEQHEDVVPEQIRLGEPNTPVVERLEYPMNVVILPTSDGDELQPFPQNQLKPLHIQGFVIRTRLGQSGAEERVGATHEVVTSITVVAFNASNESRSV